jgi:hypothetical protein
MISELPISQRAALADYKLTARIDDVHDIDTSRAGSCCGHRPEWSAAGSRDRGGCR